MGYITDEDEEVCKSNGWATNLPGALDRDDKEKFLQYLAHPSSEKDGVHGRALKNCIFSGAVNCAKAILEGEACVIVDDINAPICSYLTPLHVAAMLGYPGLVTLFLQHGASPNLRSIASTCHSKMLPINSALHDIAISVDVRRWTTKKSVFNLIIRMLLDNSNRGTLQCIRLLTSVTEGIDDEIYHYVVEGRFIELAALLLADHVKVLSVLQRTCCSDIGSGSCTLLGMITAETAMLSTMGIRLQHSLQGYLLQECEQKLLARMCTLQLFEVFRIAGDQLAEYLHSKESQEDSLQEVDGEDSRQEVAEEVAWILEEAGFFLKDEDLSWSRSGCSWFSTCKPIRDSSQHLGSDLSAYIQQGILNYPPDSCDSNKNYMYAQRYEQWRFASTKHPCGSHDLFVRHFEGLPALEDIFMFCNDSDPIFQFKEAIEKFCSHQYLKEWSSKMSIFKLIYILFLPELTNEINHIRHICDNSTAVKIALLGCYYVKEGKLIELAALLRAGHKKLISEIRSQRTAESGKIIRKFISREIWTIIDAEISSMRNSSNNELLKDKRMVMSSALLLLDVFERAGGKMESFYTRPGYIKPSTDAEVSTHFAVMLRESDFVFSIEDVSVQHLSCFSSKLPQEKLESLESYVSEKVGLSVQPRNSSHLKEIGVPRRSPHAYNPAHAFHTLRISKGSSNLVFSSPLAILANRAPNISLGGKWASLVFTVIRDLKRV